LFIATNSGLTFHDARHYHDHEECVKSECFTETQFGNLKS